MSAFDRILSGFPDVDRLLDNIRLGDNVVWRVKSLDQFRYFAEPFAERAIADGRTTVYMKFAGHEVLRLLRLTSITVSQKMEGRLSMSSTASPRPGWPAGREISVGIWSGRS